MKRAIVIVLDGVGCGELPDANLYNDTGSNTLNNIKKTIPSMKLKNLENLGLSNIDTLTNYEKHQNPIGCYGKMNEKSGGKDTSTGHFELMGVSLVKPYPTFTDTGFPQDFIAAYEKAIGTKVIGNIAASGTVIIKDLGDEHVKTGYPIVYTSADSVFQIAAHEDIIPLFRLYEICQIARAMLKNDLAVSRVIARPFTTENGEFKRTKNRKDFALLPPSKTALDYIKETGQDVYAIGKIEDIFSNQGITRKIHTTNNEDGIEETIRAIKNDTNGLIFTNLVDYDMLYGHRNDINGFKEALEHFDNKLPIIIENLKDDDILFITADHGCDPTTPSTDHSREYVPILAYGKKLKKGVNLGTLDTFSDLGKTILDYLEIGNTLEGISFLQDILSID